MKKILYIVGLLVFLSCSDGDLQIETIDFDSASVDFCTDPVATASNVLFKINSDEALILTLPSGVLNNGVIGETIITESAVPGESQLLYRIFSANVSDNYFCSTIPLTTPTVIEEIEAQDGMVIIKSVANAESTAFTHTIELSGISLVNGIGERITDLTINEFGEVTTDVP
ncbi:hypothetical protein [uncultured Croceitalea sp.]|uniref:hypothetical protein n=1 Tax=uncultured Croceitalea sp. TaxID=1798908 RepID=UPI00330628C9